jgi:hypothetical protein
LFFHFVVCNSIIIASISFFIFSASLLGNILWAQDTRLIILFWVFFYFSVMGGLVWHSEMGVGYFLLGDQPRLSTRKDNNILGVFSFRNWFGVVCRISSQQTVEKRIETQTLYRGYRKRFAHYHD